MRGACEGFVASSDDKHMAEELFVAVGRKRGNVVEERGIKDVGGGWVFLPYDAGKGYGGYMKSACIGFGMGKKETAFHSFHADGVLGMDGKGRGLSCFSVKA